MLFATIRSPGIVSLVYPLSIFGYALMEENGPKKGYWHFIMLYTQTLIVVEFSLSLAFIGRETFSAEKEEFDKFLAQYYIGISIVNNQGILSLLNHFYSKILILLSVMTLL